MAKMVDLARTDAERKKVQEGYTDPANIDDVPEYDWGTSLSFNEETLAKLGIDEMPPVGTEMMITGKVKVTGTRVSAGQNEAERKGLELQITHMSLEPEERDDSKAAAAMYPSAAKK